MISTKNLVLGSSLRRKICSALIVAAVFVGSATMNTSEAKAQMGGGNILMFDENGQFVYAITGLFATQFLHADVIGGWGTDLQTMQYCAIVPTAQPGVYVYVVAPTPSGSQAGTAGTFKIDAQGNIEWKNNKGQSGSAHPA